MQEDKLTAKEPHILFDINWKEKIAIAIQAREYGRVLREGKPAVFTLPSPFGPI